jgi:hypothetical protein
MLRPAPLWRGRAISRLAADIPAGAKAHIDFAAAFGTTKVVPCYKAYFLRDT